jgi:hypothetical protein
MAELRSDFGHIENHLYACIYDVLGSNDPSAVKLSNLHKFNAKILRLHATRTEHIMLDQSGGDSMPAEQAALYHLQNKQRRDKSTVTGICDQGQVFTETG